MYKVLRKIDLYTAPIADLRLSAICVECHSAWCVAWRGF